MAIEDQGHERLDHKDRGSLVAGGKLGRRAFLALSVFRSVIFFGLLSTPIACKENIRSSNEQRFVDAIRALHPDSDMAVPIARSAGWSEAKALAILTRGAPDESMNATRFAAFLDQRIRKDFVDGRVELIDRWTLSETEAAIAVVAAGPSL